MKTPNIISNVVLILLIIFTLLSSSLTLTRASKLMVLKNKITNGQSVYVVCGSEVSETVRPDQESTIKMVDDPEWTCYGQIGDNVSSRLYYQKYDEHKIPGKCLVEAKADGFYRWKEKEKKWEMLPLIEKLL